MPPKRKVFDFLHSSRRPKSPRINSGSTSNASELLCFQICSYLKYLVRDLCLDIQGLTSSWSGGHAHDSGPTSTPATTVSNTLTVPNSLTQNSCTRTCAIWQESLKIAQKRLAEKKLPPLENLKPCSHNLPTREEPVSTIVCSTIQDLEKTIQSKQRGKDSKVNACIDRMKDILKTFNQYAVIVDIAIQHNPKITALVWAGVRVTLQVSSIRITRTVSGSCSPWAFCLFTDHMCIGRSP